MNVKRTELFLRTETAENFATVLGWSDMEEKQIGRAASRSSLLDDPCESDGQNQKIGTIKVSIQRDG